jgi:hypothetical protein
MRQTLRNKMIATVGHDPMPLQTIVSRCGGHRGSAEKWQRVRRELHRLIARGLIARVGYRLYAASDSWVKEKA